MSTYTETQPHHPSPPPAPAAYRISRAGARAFALGAAVAALSVGAVWLASDNTASKVTNAGSTAPADVSGAAGSAGNAGGSSTFEHGASIAALQRELAYLNYYEGPVDGVLGPATVEAIKDFQRANGLAVDGVAGPATTARISKQMKTGDSQMSGSGLPAKTTPAKPVTPAKSHESSSTDGGTPTGNSGGNAVSPSGGTTPAKPSSPTGGGSAASPARAGLGD